jgi:hypothetical protein
VRVEDAPAAREEAQEVELPAGVALELIERPTPQRAEARITNISVLLTYIYIYIIYIYIYIYMYIYVCICMYIYIY